MRVRERAPREERDRERGRARTPQQDPAVGEIACVIAVVPFARRGSGTSASLNRDRRGSGGERHVVADGLYGTL